MANKYDNDTVVKDHETGHAVGSAVGGATGATAGAAAGAAIGTAVGGPVVGTLVGAAIGGAVGAMAGHGIAASVDPAVEDTYWRENHRNQPYYSSTYNYDKDYRPAYQYGWESRAQAGNKTWEAAEPELGRNWNDYNRGAARQTWDEAKHATKDAWHRVENRLPGDADGDGR